MPKTIDDLSAEELVRSLPASAPGFGMAYRNREDAMAVDSLSEPAINKTNMSVRMRISTEAIDRDGMVIKQDGIRLDYYRLNPAVLFGHGLEGIPFPVAVSQDLAGNLTVTREPDGTYARAYHRASDKVSSQIFDAVVCGLIRASSVGVTPLDVVVGFDADGEKIPVVTESMLNEWSYAALGVNPEAIVKSHLSSRSKTQLLKSIALQSEAAEKIVVSNRLDGSAVDETLMLMIKQLAPRSRGNGVGYDFGLQKQWIPADRAQTDDGKLVTSEEVLDAASDAFAASALRSSVTDPVEAASLESDLASAKEALAADAGKKKPIETNTGWDRALALMPSGCTQHEQGRARWCKNGGHVGGREVARFAEKLVAIGWSRVDSSTTSSVNEVETRTVYEDAEGNRASLVTRYGLEEVDNKFCIDLYLSGHMPKKSRKSIGKSFMSKLSLTKQAIDRMPLSVLRKSCSSLNKYDADSQELLKSAVESMSFSSGDEDLMKAGVGDDEEDDGMGQSDDSAAAEGTAGGYEDAEASLGEVDSDEPANGPESEDGLDEEVEVSGDAPYGSTLINKVHSDVSSLISKIESSMRPLERDGVETALTKLSDKLRDMLVDLEGLHTREYPDEAGPGAGDAEIEVGEELIKSWLRKSERNPVCMGVMASRINTVAAHSFLPDPQRRALVSVAKDLTRYADEVKSFKSAPVSESIESKEEPGLSPEELAELQVLQARHDELLKTVESLGDLPG